LQASLRPSVKSLYSLRLLSRLNSLAQAVLSATSSLVMLAGIQRYSFETNKTSSDSISLWVLAKLIGRTCIDSGLMFCFSHRNDSENAIFNKFTKPVLLPSTNTNVLSVPCSKYSLNIRLTRSEGLACSNASEYTTLIFFSSCRNSVTTGA